MRGIWPEGMVLKNVDTSNGDREDRGHCRPELWFRRVMEPLERRHDGAPSSSIGKISSRGLGGSIRTTRSTPASR